MAWSTEGATLCLILGSGDDCTLIDHPTCGDKLRKIIQILLIGTMFFPTARLIASQSEADLIAEIRQFETGAFLCLTLANRSEGVVRIRSGSGQIVFNRTSEGLGEMIYVLHPQADNLGGDEVSIIADNGTPVSEIVLHKGEGAAYRLDISHFLAEISEVQRVRLLVADRMIVSSVDASLSFMTEDIRVVHFDQRLVVP